MTTSQKIDLARSRVNTRAFNDYFDTKRRDFLKKLHAAAQPSKCRGIDASGAATEVIKLPRIRLTPWEQQFVADHVAEPRPFTTGQRDVIDELRQKHEPHL